VGAGNNQAPRRTEHEKRGGGATAVPAGLEGHFQLVDTARVFADRDQWIREWVRALQLKQGKRGPRVYAELRKLGVAPLAAQPIAM